MSKVLLKKKLASMSKTEIIGLVAELYDAKKEAKDYLDYWVNPDEETKLEEYKKIIQDEFYPADRREPKMRFSVCKKAISSYAIEGTILGGALYLKNSFRVPGRRSNKAARSSGISSISCIQMLQLFDLFIISIMIFK